MVSAPCGCPRNNAPRGVLLLLPLLLLLGFVRVPAPAWAQSSPYNPSAYDVVWDSASAMETESMPLGNGALTLSVWVEASTASLMYYAQSASAYDENGQLLKLSRGRIDLGLPAHPVLSRFQQRLHLLNASQTLSFSVDIAGGPPLHVSALVWVDRFHPVVHWEVSASRPVNATNAIEMWRTQPTPVGDNWHTGYYCDTRQVYPDVLYTGAGMGGGDGELMWWHRNDGDLGHSMYDASLLHQGLSDAGLPPSPLANRTFGGYLAHVDAHDWSGRTVQKTTYGVSVSLHSLRPTTSVRFDLFAHTEEKATVASWMEAFAAVVARVNATPSAARLLAHTQFWASFLNRSHVEVRLRNDSLTSYRLSQALLLQRVTDAMCGLNEYPIHFNGQGWSIGSYTDSPQGPDHRQWGSAFWWQNVRESYYPAAPSGDFDLLLPMFGFYQRLQPVQEARVRHYYGHGGAYWEETTTLYGLLVDALFGFLCEGTVQLHGNPSIRFHWDGSFELCLLTVQYYAFTGNDTFATQTLLPVCSAVMTFFRLHFPQRDADNRTILFPSQSLETWTCPDPTDERVCPRNALIYVLGLQASLQALLALPRALVPDEQHSVWSAQLQSLPPLPKGPCSANSSLTCLLPAEKGWTPGQTTNWENVELYAVWPYGHYGLGRDELELALTNYRLRPFPCNEGWCQDVVDAALLGLREDTAAMITERANRAPAVGWRFPTFIGPLQDSTPAADHYSVLRSATYAALLQEVSAAAFRLSALCSHSSGPVRALDADSLVARGRREEDPAARAGNGSVLLLFGAWPDGWDADFKLWASGPTVIEGRCVNGTLTALTVSPEGRRSDVVLLGCTHTRGSVLERESRHRTEPCARLEKDRRAASVVTG